MRTRCNKISAGREQHSFEQFESDISKLNYYVCNTLTNRMYGDPLMANEGNEIVGFAEPRAVSPYKDRKNDKSGQ
jgi:hypothetical protein